MTRRAERCGRFDGACVPCYNGNLMMATTPFVVLASGSPRRRTLLARLGIPFTVVSADVPEDALPGEGPQAMARRLSQVKARAVASRHPGALVLASDTVVALGDVILGKPDGAQRAETMLRQLRGRRHQVLTAVTSLNTLDDQEFTTCSVTDVWMRDYSDAEIAAYVATGDPLDKAGAYAIQHAGFDPVADLEGCYSGVMGFPLGHVIEALQVHGIVVPVAADAACDGWRGACCAARLEGSTNS